MKRRPFVDIVILNYNGINDTRECLFSVLKTRYPNFRITVVDNGSRTNEAKMLSEEFKNSKITFLRFNKNLGFTGANNRVVQRVKSKYIVFLNNDTIVNSSWLDELVKEMEKDKKIAACQPKILLTKDRKKFDYAGGCGGYIDKYGYPFTRGRIFFTSELDDKQYDNKTDIFWASGAAMMVRRDLFIKFGRFDELFFIYMEEIDFCWRMLKNGFKIRAVPHSVVYHKVAGSAGKDLFKKRYYEHRNNLILVAKNYSFKDLINLFPQRIILEILTVIFYLIKLDLTSFLALIKAHTDFWIIFPSLIKRAADDKVNSAELKNLIFPKSIALEYFLLGRKKFTDLNWQGRRKQSQRLVKKYTPFILGFLISIFILFIWFYRGNLIAGGEEGLSILRPQKTLGLYSSTWFETGSGYPMPVYLPRITFFAFAEVLNTIFPIWAVQAISFGLLITVGVLSVFFLAEELVRNKKIAGAAALFYFFNLYSQSQIWGRFLYSGIFVWAYLSLFLFLWIRWLREKKAIWLAVLLLTLFFFSNIFGMPANVFTLWVPAGIFIIVELFRKRGNLRSILKLALYSLLAPILWVVTNIWWIYPYLKLGQSSFKAVEGTLANFNSLLGVSQYFPTSQIVLLRQNFLFGSGQYGNWYNQPWVYGISTLVFLIVVLGIFAGRKSKEWAFFITLFLVGWFISKGANPPFGKEFFGFIFNIFPPLQALRNPYEKFGIVFVLPYSIFFGLGLSWIYLKLNFANALKSAITKGARMGIVACILVLSCGVLVWPMWTGEVFGAGVINARVKVPTYYKKANMFLNSDPSDGRILMLPIIPGDGVRYDWKDGYYQGVEPSEFLFDRPSVSKMLRTEYFDDKYFALYHAFISRRDYGKYLDEMNIKYLVLHNDLDSKISGASTSAEAEKTLEKNKEVKFIKKFGELEIYQYTGNKNPGLFIAQGQNVPRISYQKLSPTRYRVFVKNAKKPFDLIFRETFSKLWVARIGDKELKDHFLVYNYANGWRVNEKGDYAIDVIFKVWPWE